MLFLPHEREQTFPPAENRVAETRAKDDLAQLFATADWMELVVHRQGAAPGEYERVGPFRVANRSVLQQLATIVRESGPVVESFPTYPFSKGRSEICLVRNGAADVAELHLAHGVLYFYSSGTYRLSVDARFKQRLETLSNHHAHQHPESVSHHRY